MNAPQPAVRPYRVHLDVLAFTGSFWAPRASFQRWADLSLTAEQAETLTGGADRGRILKELDFPMSSVLAGWAVSTAALVLVGCIPGAIAAVPAAVWCVGTGVLALILGRRWRFLGRARRRIDRTLIPAAVGGSAHWVSLHDKEWSRLYRIETALTVLQAHAGPAYDEQARAAVVHVINPPPPPREPDTAPKGTSPRAQYRAAMHGIFSSLLKPAKAQPPVDPVAALEAEAARFRAG